MNAQFLKQVSGLELRKEDRLLLAISGGLDSMVMAHLFKTNGFNFAVAHVNFQLRQADSEQDEQFVKAWCEDHNVPFFCARFETNNYATENKLSIQMAARELRYAWFDQIISNEGFRYVATAHHLNDSLETVLINLTRGCGLEGLAGIPVKSGNRIRPLLFASRLDIESYAAENAIAWREDVSNFTDDYQRNFIRHQVMPLLKKVNPSLEDTFRVSTTKIQREVKLLRAEMERWKRTHLIREGEVVRIDKRGLVPEDGEARLWHVLKAWDFSYSQCEDIISAITGQPGKQFLAPTHTLVVDREFLVVTPHRQIDAQVEITPSQKSAHFGLQTLRLEFTQRQTFSSDRQIAYFDADTVSFPLTWRAWRPGDSFYPLGMTHRKKISDFLVDNKISRGEKDFVTVLESGGEIIWVVGHRIDNRFKITAETRNALSIFIHSDLSQ